ncbi:MAG: hypothetical protein IPH41_11000 [Sulfuritalea sp.]|nr:hypothetical protein [Sulfuritalea sp.]
MSDRNRYLFALRLGGFMDAGNFDYRMSALAREIDNLIANLNIADLNIAASQRIDPNEGAARKLPERDLCRQLARLYRRKFGRAPSANELGTFGRFIGYLTENCLPAGYETTIGSDLLRFAANEGTPL